MRKTPRASLSKLSTMGEGPTREPPGSFPVMAPPSSATRPPGDASRRLRSTERRSSTKAASTEASGRSALRLFFPTSPPREAASFTPPRPSSPREPPDADKERIDDRDTDRRRDALTAPPPPTLAVCAAFAPAPESRTRRDDALATARAISSDGGARRRPVCSCESRREVPLLFADDKRGGRRDGEPDAPTGKAIAGGVSGAGGGGGRFLPGSCHGDDEIIAPAPSSAAAAAAARGIVKEGDAALSSGTRDTDTARDGEGDRGGL